MERRWRVMTPPRSESVELWRPESLLRNSSDCFRRILMRMETGKPVSAKDAGNALHTSPDACASRSLDKRSLLVPLGDQPCVFITKLRRVQARVLPSFASVSELWSSMLDATPSQETEFQTQISDTGVTPLRLIREFRRDSSDCTRGPGGF